ncbi:baseplate assembly protein [Paenibacillus sp. UNC451MF]|uniref:baseplate assembly protein n=1 Tax=Paenibacillus sp. UNC451MF TaxID=1449063 RepID=UPI00048AE57A|nr:baseplate J/gp47 family protein [Paenibacillus sp. UNC451MF]
MNLSELKDVQFVTADVTETTEKMITIFEALTERKLYPGDPVRLFLLSIGSIIVQQRALIDQTAKRNLLRYTSGDYLDHLGAFAETPRLDAVAAITVLRFFLSAIRPDPVLIPIRTRVGVKGGSIVFETTEVKEIPPGSLFIDIPAICTLAGTAGNDFLPGQIVQIVDPIAFISQASNLTTTSGGANRESDDAYRVRIHEAPESFSVAGPSAGYRHWAKTVSSAIIDVAVYSPAPGEVHVVPLMDGGDVPSGSILTAVSTVCNDKTIRPLTDHVTVKAPTVVHYHVAIQYWIDINDAVDAARVQTAVTEAVNGFVLWQKSKLGRAINPSELVRRVMQAGARRVDITDLVHTPVGASEVAIADTIEIHYGGLEGD